MQHFSRFSVPGFHVPTSTIDRVVGNLGESLEFRDEDLGDEDVIEHRVEDQPAAEEERVFDIADGARSAEGLRVDETVCSNSVWSRFER